MDDDGLYFKGGTEDPGDKQDLQSKLDEYNRNFEALNNFLGDNSLSEANVATELRVEKTKEMLSQALPYGVKTIVEVAAFGQSESIRLKAAIYLVDRCLGKDDNTAVEDQATQLLRKISVKSNTERGDD